MPDTNLLRALQIRRRQILAALESCQDEMVRCHEQLRRLDEEETNLLNESPLIKSDSSIQRPTDARSSDHPLFDDRRKPESRWTTTHPQRKPRRVKGSDRVVQVNKLAPNKGKGTPFPSGVPSIAQMVEIILLEARAKKKPGVTGAEILQEINKRWWPGVSETSVIPKMYRLQRKQQKFILQGDHWDLGR